MSTYGELTNKILDDLDRSDMTSQAQDAIDSAINFYRVRPWFFLEARATAQTVANQEFFPLPDDYESHLLLSINISGNQYTLTQRTMDWIEERAVSSSLYTGNPTDFAIWDEQIRLYPIPNAVHTMTMSYRRQLSDLESASSSNAWTIEGFELIRRHASADVAGTILRDYQLSDRLKLHELEELQNITMQNILKLSTGRVRRYKS